MIGCWGDVAACEEQERMDLQLRGGGLMLLMPLSGREEVSRKIRILG